MFAVSIKKNLPVSVNPEPGYFPALPITQSVKRPGFNEGLFVSLCFQCPRLPHDGRRTHLRRFTRKDFDCLTFPGRDNQPPLASSRCTWLACHSNQSTIWTNAYEDTNSTSIRLWKTAALNPQPIRASGRSTQCRQRRHNLRLATHLMVIWSVCVHRVWYKVGWGSEVPNIGS